MNQNISIESNFESANIDDYSVKNGEINFTVRKDKGGDNFHWFYFQIKNINYQRIKFNLLNSGESFYPSGWYGYLPVYSSDNLSWRRVDGSSYKSGKFSFWIDNPPQDFYIAWYEPYPYHRYQWWLNNIWRSSKAVIEEYKLSNSKYPFHLIRIGEVRKDTQNNIWVIARQHPGETMGSWFCEGLTDFLLSNEQSAIWLKSNFTFYIVPMMNPDGVVSGNHRLNSSGVDLNRKWKNPRKDTEPSVYLITQKMMKYMPCLFLDIHGEEVSPLNYIAGKTSDDKNYLENQNRLLKTMAKYDRYLTPLLPPETLIGRLIEEFKLKLKKFLGWQTLNNVEFASNKWFSEFKIPSFTYELTAHWIYKTNKPWILGSKTTKHWMDSVKNKESGRLLALALADYLKGKG